MQKKIWWSVAIFFFFIPADKLRAVWTPDEVRVLLSRWAEESVQEQLRSNPRNERAFAQLSSELATQGFDKTTSQCRSKIALLTQRYRRIKAQEDPEKQKSRWFAIMDEVLSRSKTDTETKPVRDSERASLQTSQQSLPDTAEGKMSSCLITLQWLTESSCSKHDGMWVSVWKGLSQPRRLNLL